MCFLQTGRAIQIIYNWFDTLRLLCNSRNRISFSCSSSSALLIWLLNFQLSLRNVMWFIFALVFFSCASKIKEINFDNICNQCLDCFEFYVAKQIAAELKATWSRFVSKWFWPRRNHGDYLMSSYSLHSLFLNRFQVWMSFMFFFRFFVFLSASFWMCVISNLYASPISWCLLPYFFPLLTPCLGSFFLNPWNNWIFPIFIQ